MRLLHPVLCASLLSAALARVPPRETHEDGRQRQSALSHKKLAPPPLRVPTSRRLSTCDSGLDCWLQNIQFDIPKITVKDIKVGVLKYDLTVEGLTCYGVSIDGIDSSYLPEGAVDATVKNVATSCKGGKWKLKGITTYKGSLSVKIKKATMACAVSVLPNEQGLPWTAHVPSCKVSSVKVSYHIGDSSIGWILDVLQSEITPIIEKNVKKALCKLASDGAETKLTPLLQKQVDPAIERVIASEPSIVPSFPYETLDWGDDMLTRLLAAASTWIENEVDKRLDDLTKGTGELEIPVNKSTTLTGILGHTVTYTLQAVKLGGLTALEDVSFLTPSTESSAVLESEFKMQALSASVELRTLVHEVENAGGNTLDESFVFEVEMSDLQFAGSLIAAVELASLRGLLLGEVAQVACLLDTVRDLRLSSLDVEVDVGKITIYEPDAPSLESDVDDLINNGLLILTENYHDLVTSFIAGMAQGSLRDAANDLISSYLDKLRSENDCIPPETEPLYVDWQSSAAFTAVSSYVNDQVGPEGLNGLIDQATEPTPGQVSVKVPTPLGHFHDVFLKVLGLDTFTNLTVLTARPDHVIHNAASLQTLQASLSWPLMHASDVELRTNATFALEALDVSMDLVALIDVHLLMNQEVGEILDILKMQNVSQNAACLFDAVADLEVIHPSASIDNALITFKGKEVGKDVTPVVQGAINEVLKYGAGVFNDVSDLMATDAAYVCSGQAIPYPEACPLPKAIRPTCEDSVLGCLYEQVSLEVPDVSLAEWGLELNISSVQCETLGGLNFTSSTSNDDLHLDIRNASFGCFGQWAFRADAISGPYAGDFCATIEGFSLGFDAEMGVGEVLPSYVEMVNCRMSDVDVSIEFHDGGPLGFALNVARRYIDIGVEKLFESGACTIATTLVNPLLARVVQNQVDPALQAIMDNEPAAVPEADGMLNWQQVSWYHALETAVDAVLSPSSTCAGINAIVDWWTNSTGQLAVPLDLNVSIPLAGDAFVEVELQSVHLSGLSTFEDLALLHATAPNVLQSSFRLRDVAFALEMVVRTNYSLASVLEERVTFQLEMEDLTGIADLVVGVDQNRFEALHLDQATEMGCLLDTVRNLTVASLTLGVGSMAAELLPRSPVSGMQADVIDLVNNILVVLSGQDFEQLLSALVAGLAQGPIRDAFNALLSEELRELAQSNPECPAHGVKPADGYVEFNSSAFIGAFDKLVDDIMGPSGLNRLAECLTNGTGLVHEQVEVSGAAPPLDVTLFGLMTFFEMDLLRPSPANAYLLTNLLGVGGRDGALGSGFVGLAAQNESFGLVVDVPNGFAAEVALQNLALGLDVTTEVNRTKLFNLTVGQLQTPSCIASSMDEFVIDAFSADFSSVTLGLQQDGQVYTSDLTAVLRDLLSYAEDHGALEMANAAILQNLEESQRRCAEGQSNADEGSTAGDEDDASVWNLLIVCLLGLVLLLALVWAGVRYCRSLSGRSCDQGMELAFLKPPESASASLAGYSPLEGKEDGAEGQNPYSGRDLVLDTKGDGELRLVGPALVQHPRIPLWVRLGVPSASFLTIGLFIWSNLSAGADVLLTLTAEDGFEYAPESLMTFTLANTVRDMWNAKVYPLAVLVAVFSGGWPYVKLVLMVCCWVLPPRLLSAGLRDKMLCYLDFLGKWSLIDAYVGVLLMAAFRLDIMLEMDGAYLDVDVVVKPEWGYYSFLIATMASLALSHVVLAMHRRAESHATDPEHGKRETLSSHLFQHPTRSKWAVRLTAVGRTVISFLICLTGLLVAVGAAVTSYQFEFKGLTGLLLQDDATRPFSLISTGQIIPSSSGEPDSWGVRFIQASFFAFALAVPVALVVSMLALWNARFSVASLRRVFVFTEVLNAWCAVDVFVISLLAAVLEISQFAEFIIGDDCDAINRVLEKYFASYIPGSPVCFDVVTVLDNGCWLLLGAGLLFNLLFWPLMMLSKLAVEERTEMEGIPDENGIGLEEALLSAEERQEKLSESRSRAAPFGPRTTAILLAARVLEEVPMSGGPGRSFADDAPSTGLFADGGGDGAL